jgi:lysophospholipase L1-like esterase
MRLPLTTLILPVLSLCLSVVHADNDWKFDFGSGPVKDSWTKVSATTTYNPATGYGFIDTTGITDVDRKTADTLLSDFCASSTPFLFSAKVPEGNYDVTVYFGDPSDNASTSIKAEDRRLIMPETPTKAGELKTWSFTVNVHTPTIAGGNEVKSVEGRYDWDDQLTLEFNGKRPCIEGVEIKDAQKPITIYIAGDSTVCDQGTEPWCAWGQCLPRFFSPGVSIANYARSGLALYSFEGTNRLKKILSTIQKGDYLFIQFGHNDQKDKHPGAGPWTSYKDNLRHYIAAAREKGAIPVIVTPMERRRWDKDNNFNPTLADFAEAARQIGYEQTVPVIDLNAMSMTFYKALGPDGTKKAFVFFPTGTFPGQDKELKDETHFNSYGAYELARCVVDGIRDKVPELVPFLRTDVGVFDPTKPDAPESIGVPRSLTAPIEKPAGN